MAIELMQTAILVLAGCILGALLDATYKDRQAPESDRRTKEMT